MLLSGLQGEAVGRCSLGINRDAYESSRHGALELLAHRQVAGVWSTKAHGDSKALGRAADDIGTLFTRRGDQGKGH